jgi:carboxypeptidase family protein
MVHHLRSAVLVVVALAAVPSISYAQASITGVIRDASGAVLPGVTVEASSPALIERVRVSVSDGTGQYRIENLRPGAYAVTFTLPGFSTVRREGIQLTGDFVASVDGELRVGTVEETITVTGAAPVVDVQSTTRQTVLNRELLDVLPAASAHPGFLAALIPGVESSTPDVGGINGVGRGANNISIHGGGGVQTQVQGLSMASANGSGNTGVMNLAAFQEMAVDTSGLGADQKQGGVRMQFIPRDGGNVLSASMVMAYANSSMQSDNFTQELRDQGLGTPNALKKIWDVNPAAGGPIRRDRLWFHSTFRYTGASSNVPMFFNKNAGNPSAWTYEPDTSRPAGTEDVWAHMNSRLTWQATAKHKIAFGIDYSQEQTRPRSLTALTAPESTASDYARLAPKRYLTSDWTAPMTNRILFEGAILKQDEYASRPAAGHNPFLPPGTLLSSVLEQSTNLRYRASAGGGSNTGTTLSRTIFGRVSMSYITGAHALRVGFNYGSGSQRQHRVSIDSPMDFRFNNGVPNRLTLRATPIDIDTDINADHGLFVQDRWTVNRLTLTIGLRYDYLHISYPETHVGPGEFAPGRAVTFPETDGVRWHTLAPRSGVAYDIFGDGKTALKVGLNKYFSAQAVGGVFGRDLAPSSAIVASTNRTWNDVNRNFVPDCVLLNPAANGECGAMDNPAFGTARRTLTVDPDLLSGAGRQGSEWQFSAGVQREILAGVSVDVSYFRTWLGNFLVTDDRAVAPSDYDTFSITAPIDPRLPEGGGYVISGLYDLKPEKFGLAADNFLTAAETYGKQTRHWNGVDVSVNARPRADLLLSGGVSTGRATADNCEVVAKLDNPSPLYCHQQEKFRTQVKFLGVYTVPRIDLQISGSFQNTPGPEITANYVASLAEVQPSLGRPLAGGARNVTVNLVAPGTMYGDRLTQVDLRIGKILQIGHVRATPTLDVYNLLNVSTVLSQSNVYGPTWQQPQSILPARFAKIGLQLAF